MSDWLALLACLIFGFSLRAIVIYDTYKRFKEEK